MTVIEALHRDSRVIAMLTANVLAYILLGMFVVAYGFYCVQTGKPHDLYLDVALLGIAAKGFLIGFVALMTAELIT